MPDDLGTLCAKVKDRGAPVKRAKQRDLPLEPFTVHDLRRTESTRLNEFGFSSDRIEKSFLEVSRQKESVA